MPGSILVARLLGIDIRIHLSWFLIFGLIILSLADRVLPELRPNWSDSKTVIVAAITALLFFASILVHELAHAIVARRFRMPVSSITLFLLGGVANLAKEPPSAKSELLMAGAGPLTSLVLGVLGIGVAFLVEERLAFSPALDPVGVVASYLGVINVALAVFNMIPGFPLDGGRVLRAAVWGIRGDRSLATRVAGRGGQIVAGALVLYGAFRLFSLGDTFGGVWSALIAYFLYNAASASIAQDRISSAVGGAKVASLMRTDFRTIPSGTAVGSLIKDLVLPYNLSAVPVVFGERIVGLVTIGDLRKVDQERWASTPVNEVMTKDEQLASVSPDDTIVTALERFGAHDLPLLPVVQRSSLVGLLDREAVVSYVRMREMLGLEARR
ncbi:MAG: site-2 protease family protein [Candidatus Limnocylindria bacterium]